MVDTNVFLAATDRSQEAHDRALNFLNTDTRRLALTAQIVREYLAVATRPVEANGLGLSGSHASANVEQFLSDIELLPEDMATSRTVMQMVGSDLATGKQVHDANIVAVALAHNADTIVTDNTAHFLRFSDLIAIESLL